MSCVTEHLIEVIFTYPLLYDVNHKDYKNIRKKKKVWEDIGKMLHVSGEELKKKWKNLRDSYMKYLRSIKTSTGQAKKNYKSWTWATQMERFKPFLGSAKTISNVSEAEIEAQLNNSSIRETIVVGNTDNTNILVDGLIDDIEPVGIIRPEDITLPSEPQQKKRKQQATGNSNDVDKVVKYLEGKHKTQLDATDHLMMGYAKTIKTFSRARQADIKFKIAQLINQHELEQIKEEERSPVCPSSVGAWVNSNPSYPNDEELEQHRFSVYSNLSDL